MKIVVLEDDPIRICSFVEWFPNDDLCIFNNVKNFVECAKTADVLFFDHDLGGKAFVDSSDENCGAEAARQLVEKLNCESHSVKGAIVHSWNPEGAANIARILATSHQIGKVVVDPFNHMTPQRIQIL